MLYHVKMIGEGRRILSTEYYTDNEFHEKSESGSAYTLLVAENEKELKQKMAAFWERFPDSRPPQEEEQS